MDTSMMKVEEACPGEDLTLSAGSFRISSEIIMHILRFLCPTDIISMRKTCRMMHRITKCRVVWLEALERVCEKYGIFKPTFPMETMSILELEHASTGPVKFLGGVKMYHDEECVRPYLTRTPQLRRERSSHDSYSYDTFHLVPGGRFLLTSDLNTIWLFDLGYNMNVPVKPLPLATLEGFGEMQSIAPTTNGKELLIASLKRFPYGGPEPKPILYIHQISPNHGTKDSKFLCKRKLELQTHQAIHIGNIHLTSTFVFFKCKEEFVLWNWAENTGCRWPTFNTHLYLNTYPFKDTILAPGQNEEIYVYDLPTPTSLIATDQARPVKLDDLESITNGPKASFPPPGSASGRNGADLCTPSVWCETSPFDPHVCVIYPNEITSHLQLYSMKPMKDPESPFFPRSLPAPGGHTIKFYGDDHSSSFYQLLPSIFRFDDELVICTSSHERGLLMSILPVPSKATLEEITPTTVVLVPSGSLMQEIEPTQFAFCPMSGRVVYFGSSGMSDDVQIVDYLLPPEEVLQEP
ncbi:hypothetical protein DFP72DRAFT_423288 [Ephemerocybe angulata]|uniref:F-box domain-containing protein n=1 Tax=Ephemerocybe angulata TaxID=980116 RepID=A0A8H6MDG8_9AGAR|nr:hypothetical protein DFP72DRAFT_423288 [Tulosesus angulatus]